MIDDDFGSSDEVKIFKDEGEDEEKEFASQEELQAALSEDKSSLIQGNSLKGIGKETFRKEEISNKNYLCSLFKEGHCKLFFCHSHNDIGNVILLFLSKATG